MPTPRPFDLVSENLRKLGAIPIAEYLAATRRADISATSLGDEFKSSVTADAPTALVQPHGQDAAVSAGTNTPLKEDFILKLEDAVESTYPDHPMADILRFEIARRSGDQDGIQCILTISRPDSASRVYESQACHSRDHDAKVQAAETAVKNGAIELIRHGDVEMQDPEQVPQLPAPVLSGDDGLDTNVDLVAIQDRVSIEEGELEDDVHVLEIERACKEATASPPDWFVYETETEPRRWGAALRVHLAAPQVYSTDAAYNTAFDAKAACAGLAIGQHVIRDIKNFVGSAVALAESEKREHPARPTGAISLDDWFAALPRPLPDIFGTKSAGEIPAAGILNNWITKASSCARPKCVYFSPAVHLSDVCALHGSVLRIERPGECRSYLVDPVFSTQHEARQAVALLAITQGAGEYIARIAAEVQGTTLTPRSRTLVQERIYPIIGRTRAGDERFWTFSADREAHGCTLTVRLGAEERTYVAQPAYRTKADAKCAAALEAAEHGVVEFMRFRGEPPPRGYVPFWETFRAAVQEDDGTAVPEKEEGKKRKREEGEPAPSASAGRRKRKKVLQRKMAEEAAAAAASGHAESGGSSAEPHKPSTGGSEIVGEALSALPSATHSNAKPQPPSAAATPSLSQKALGKKPVTDSGAVTVGKSKKSKSIAKSKTTANPIPVPPSYERPQAQPTTSAHPYPRPPSLPQRPAGHALPPRPPPAPYDLAYGPPHPIQHIHQRLHPPLTFGVPHPQHYPFTGPYSAPPPPVRGRRGVSPPRYAYGPGISPQQYVGNAPGPGGGEL
ncbi:hypothetical protein LshimejAT787_0705160 [Lyophyllum shimeji]|uniref:DRBM domain-containing protein n=1 Tax=Lyophyllum shimeji TaxID=47721 RepID=A0A9P3PRH0_LYOSH|nr:hypothetical protein LshimejAT787_0705160 [Lyophyllum shimeji]